MVSHLMLNTSIQFRQSGLGGPFVVLLFFAWGSSRYGFAVKYKLTKLMIFDKKSNQLKLLNFISNSKK